MPKDLVTKVKKVAKENGQTLSGLIRVSLLKELKNERDWKWIIVPILGENQKRYGGQTKRIKKRKVMALNHHRQEE